MIYGNYWHHPEFDCYLFLTDVSSNFCVVQILFVAIAVVLTEFLITQMAAPKDALLF